MGPAHRSRAARWLAYPLLNPTAAEGHRGLRGVGAEGGGMAEDDQEEQRNLAEPLAFLDALRLTCALCSELALGDQVTAAAAFHLLTDVLPAGRDGGPAILSGDGLIPPCVWISSVYLTLLHPLMCDATDLLDQQALQLIGQLREAVQAYEEGHMDEGADGLPSEAEEARTANEALASELESLVSELGQWRVYFDLDHSFQEWQEQYAQVAADSAAPVPSLLADGARDLLGGMTDLLASGWLGWLGQIDRVMVEEHDGGREGDEPISVELTLTGRPANADSEAEWLSGEAAFPSLKGAELYEAETRLRAMLQCRMMESATRTATSGEERASGELDVHVVAPPGLDGFLRVQISCRPEPGVSHGALHESADQERFFVVHITL